MWRRSISSEDASTHDKLRYVGAYRLICSPAALGFDRAYQTGTGPPRLTRGRAMHDYALAPPT